MKTFFKSFQNNTQQAVTMSSRLSLTRVFVETGNERCPLAGVWSRLPETDAAADDEAGLSWPAQEVLLMRALPWAGHWLLSSGIHRFAISY